MKIRSLQFVFIIVVLLSVISCSKKERAEAENIATKEKLVTDDSIVLNELNLVNFDVDNYLLPGDDSNELLIEVDNSKHNISNLVSYTFLDKNFFSFFLSTEDSQRQILLVMNKETGFIKNVDYYPATSHFFTEELVSFVILPYEERHLVLDIIITDFNYDVVYKKSKSLRRSFDDYKIQDLYYLSPSFGKKIEDGELNIFLEQAHYPMGLIRYEYTKANTDYPFSLISGSSNDNGYSINELNLSSNQNTEFNLSGFQGNYYIVCSQKKGDYDIAIATTKEASLNWCDYFILISSFSSSQKQVVALSSVFKYQDQLVSIANAIPIDSRGSFIIETAEFKYDFYIDPATLITDAFLRPSSFTTRYTQ